MDELEYWTRQIKLGRITRREFLGRAAVLGITPALAATMLSQAGVAATPKKGGSAKFGLAHGATTDNLDPAGYPDAGTQVPFWGSYVQQPHRSRRRRQITLDIVEAMEPGDDPSPGSSRSAKE